MASFFDFQTGDANRALNEVSPLLGRFRAVPDPQQRVNATRQQNSNLGRRRSVGRGLGLAYGTVFGGIAAGSEDSEDGEGGGWRSWGRGFRDLWMEPKQNAVARAVDIWAQRWALLALLPAALAVAWCALPFPQYDLLEFDDNGGHIKGHETPGHGAARVEINFWFFLFVYYGAYNLTALMWITKVFNIYSLNWWPKMLGFPFTICTIAFISIAAPVPLYFILDSPWFFHFNTTWILWTFFAMTMPLIIAFAILMTNERHLGLRQDLSETQRIFTSSWWTGDQDYTTVAARDRARTSIHNSDVYDPNAPLEVALAVEPRPSLGGRALTMRKRWIPASFMRFIWFCTALFIGMLAYVLGEAYAEIYLRTLPHNTFDTLVYVYSWVITVHLLDGLTGWILGGKEGERVGSYPLGWIFKLYFSLTYQTYVRALYARLRSYTQFIYLQIISSSFLIIVGPLTMSAPFHFMLQMIGINGQTLPAYQKFRARNIFIRTLSESTSMLAFLGSILVLHYGANKDVYPYFAFDKFKMPTEGSDPGHGGWEGRGEDYDFGRTFYASLVTWACEITAGWIIRRILWFGWKVDVTGEAKQDLGMWPELLPTGVVVMVHVLQNMLFSIVRLHFH